MTYDELSEFGRLRKVEKCGPYSIFTKLVHEWGARLSPRQIAEKVKLFYFEYARNRHKMTTLTPSYHAVRYDAFFFLLFFSLSLTVGVGRRRRIVRMTTVCFVLALRIIGVRFEPIFVSGFDMRPFLYPSRFPWQFRKIDDVAALLPDRSSVVSSIEPEQKTKTE